MCWSRWQERERRETGCNDAKDAKDAIAQIVHKGEHSRERKHNAN